MNNLMQTPSRLALIALLAAAPAVLTAQTTTTVAPGADTNTNTTTTTEGAADTNATTETTTEAEVTTETDAGEEVEGAAEATGEAVEGAAEATGEAVEGAAEATGEAVEGAADATGEAVEGAADATDNAVEGTATVTTETTTDAEVTTNEAEVTTETEAVGSVEGQIVLQDEDSVLAKDLIGTRVYSSEGESIGEINDIIINLNGTVEGVVIGVGGFLGIGEKDVAIQMNAVSLAADENNNMRLVTSSTEADLEAAEGFVTADEQRASQAPMATDPMAPAADGTAPMAPAADGTAPAGTATTSN